VDAVGICGGARAFGRLIIFVDILYWMNRAMRSRAPSLRARIDNGGIER